jgi:hypothetical protein
MTTSLRSITLQPHDLAIFYHEHGWPIFPCRSQAEEVADPTTSELITLNEKTPKTSNGFKGASKFRRIIDRWWSDWPDSAVGIPTGAATGVFVLDIDNKPGGANGFDWLSDMEAEHGPLPETARVTTPNGGLHIYFNYVVGTRNRGALGGGVDIRSEGGYVLAAGSQMSDGRAYEWSPAGDTVPPIADAPEWLLSLLLPKPSTATTSYHPSAIGNTPYVTAAIQSELDNLASTPSGGRNNRLNDAAFALGQFVGAGVLARSEAERELQAIAQPWGNFPKSCGTIRNGLNAGMLNPRTIPEPSFQEDNTRLVDVSRMIANGIAKGKAKLAAVHEDAVSDQAAPPETEAPPEQPAPPSTAANDNAPPILATAFKWIDPKTLPRREFAFGTHYIRKYVSVTVSPGGLGKTSNSIVEALSMTSGRSLSGTKPPAPLRVWIFNAEDPRDELERRIMAACIHYNLKPEDIEGSLFLDTGREQELVVAIEDKRAGVKIQSPIVEAVCEQILANEIDVMIVDPFVSTHGVNENDNGAIDKVAKLWARIADYTNVSIDIVHHLRKVADREATVEDARGAVSLIGAARSVRVLNRMSEEQATSAGIGANDRFGYFSVTYGKSNLTPLSSRLDWRKLESVPLGNGRGLTKPQDHAPVVTEWRWPDKAEMIEDVTAQQRDQIASRVNNCECKMHHQAKDWVGFEVAYVMGWDAADGAIKKRIRRMVDAWLDDGFLSIDKRRDPIKREMKDYVVARAA